MQDLETSVVQWASEKGILDKSTKIKQALKTLEETLELLLAIVEDDREQIKDAIGDIQVTNIIQAHMNGTNMEECLRKAYETIALRTGKMENGFFVKDSTATGGV